jgi:hypothetical protein
MSSSGGLSKRAQSGRPGAASGKTTGRPNRLFPLPGSGATLVQLVVILAVVGIFALLALAGYREWRVRAYLSEARETAISWKTTAVGYWHARGSYQGATDQTVGWRNPPSRVWDYGANRYGPAPWVTEAWFVANLKPGYARAVGLAPFDGFGTPDYMLITPVSGPSVECGRLLRRDCPDGRQYAARPPSPPDAPVLRVPAETVEERAFVAEWTDVSQEDSYELIWRRVGDPGWQRDPGIPANTTQKRVSGLSPGTQYEVAVLAVNQAGSAQSNVVQVTTAQSQTPPAAPERLRLGSATTTSFTVVWQDVADNETGYRVEWRPSGSQSWNRVSPDLPANSTSATVSGLSQRQSLYDVRVAAFNHAGSSSWVQTTVSTAASGAPAPPGNLRVVEVTSKSLLIAWDINAANATGQQVYYRQSGAYMWIPVVWVQRDETMAQVTDLVPGKTYEVRLRAVSRVGDTPVYSNWVETTIGLPGAVGPACAPSLDVSDVTASSLSFSWTTGCEVGGYRLILTEVGRGQAGTVQLHSNFANITMWGLRESSFTNSGVTYNVTLCAEGEPEAPQRCRTRQASTWKPVGDLPYVSNLSASVVAGTYIVASWSPASKEQKYVLRINGFRSRQSRTLPAGLTTYVIQTTDENTYVQVILEACNGFGCAQSSRTVRTGSTPRPGSGPAPSPPAWVNADSAGGPGIRVTWARVTGASWYVLRWRPSGSGTWSSTAVLHPLNMYVLIGSPNTLYEIEVAARNGSNESAAVRTTFLTGGIPRRIPDSPPQLQLVRSSDGRPGELTVGWTRDLRYGAQPMVEVLRPDNSRANVRTLPPGSGRMTFGFGPGTYRVRARWINPYRSGEVSEWSEEIQVVIGPHPFQIVPQIQTGRFFNGTWWVLARWNRPPGQYDWGYAAALYIRGGLVVGPRNIGKGGTMFYFSGLERSQEYGFCIESRAFQGIPQTCLTISPP